MQLRNAQQMEKTATNVAQSHFAKMWRSKQNKTSRSNIYHIQNEDFSDVKSDNDNFEVDLVKDNKKNKHGGWWQWG